MTSSWNDDETATKQRHMSLPLTMLRRYWCPLLAVLCLYYVLMVNYKVSSGNKRVISRHRTDSKVHSFRRNVSKLRGIEPRIYPLSEFDLSVDRNVAPVTVNKTTDGQVTAITNDLDVFQSVYPKIVTAPEVTRWHVVKDAEVYMYSAHRDARHPGRCNVIVFGIIWTRILKDRNSVRLYCHLVTEEFGIVDTVLGTIQTTGVRNYKYEGFQLQCRFDSGMYVVNQSLVSVVTGAWQQPISALEIQDNLHTALSPVNFTLCCADVLNNYTEYARFLEWMELNLIIGVQRFVIYIDSSDRILESILDSYEREGILEVVRLTGFDQDMHSYMHLASLQECLLRNVLRTKYLLYESVDELIAPRDPRLWTLSELIRLSKCADNGYISALNYYFDPAWPDDVAYRNADVIGRRLRLVTLLKTRREAHFWSFENRSRYIVRPEMVDHVKPHRVWLRHPGTNFACVIHPDLGALHHYDNRPPTDGARHRKTVTSYNDTNDDDDDDDDGGGDVMNGGPESVLDRSIHKYAKLLTIRVIERYNKLGSPFYHEKYGEWI